MNEEKKNKKTERLGIIAIATAGLCWLCVLKVTPFELPFELIYLLPVSAVTAVLSLKTVLGKIASVSIFLIAPAYVVINYGSLAPAL